MHQKGAYQCLLSDLVPGGDAGMREIGCGSLAEVDPSWRSGGRFSGTTTAQLVEMATWLRHWHVARVVIESTSTY